MSSLMALAQEYSHLRTESDEVDWEHVQSVLTREHDWTDSAASHLVALAQDYGAFVLKNAAALAEALNVEDGALAL